MLMCASINHLLLLLWIVIVISYVDLYEYKLILSYYNDLIVKADSVGDIHCFQEGILRYCMFLQKKNKK